mgnify:CR=1 FL=1
MEKGIEKILDDFTFKRIHTNKTIRAPICIEHQYMWSLKYFIDDIETYENKKCLHVLKRGKNKGKQCSRNCHIGMNYCLIPVSYTHLRAHET